MYLLNISKDFLNFLTNKKRLRERHQHWGESKNQSYWKFKAWIWKRYNVIFISINIVTLSLNWDPLSYSFMNKFHGTKYFKEKRLIGSCLTDTFTSWDREGGAKKKTTYVTLTLFPDWRGGGGVPALTLNAYNFFFFKKIQPNAVKLCKFT